MLLNGPESFTPDGNFILGEAPEVKNVFVGAGFNAFGIASGGGAGMALAEWVATGAPPFALWTCDIRRFVRKLIDVEMPDVHVVSFAELLPEVTLRPVARASLVGIGT